MDADDLWVTAPEGFTKTQVPSVTPSLDENENDLLGPQFLLPSLSQLSTKGPCYDWPLAFYNEKTWFIMYLYFSWSEITLLK